MKSLPTFIDLPRGLDGNMSEKREVLEGVDQEVATASPSLINSKNHRTHIQPNTGVATNV